MVREDKFVDGFDVGHVLSEYSTDEKSNFSTIQLQETLFSSFFHQGFQGTFTLQGTSQLIDLLS